MYDYERIQALQTRLGLPVMLPPRLALNMHEGYYPELHRELDAIDKAVGVITRHGLAHVYHAGGAPFPQSEYVGARLRRLERHVIANEAPPYFYLGAEAA